jgi:hypothetical protein
MKTLLSLTFFSLTFSLGAKTLDLNKVSSGSNWIMHMDFDSMRNSDFGMFLEDSFENNPEIKSKIDEMVSTYGIDLRKASNFTMYGSGEKHKGIGILEGGVNASNVEKFADSKDFISETKLGKQSVFSVEKGRHPMTYTALKKGKMIFGPNHDYISEGILMAKGKGTGASDHPLLTSLSTLLPNPGFMFFANLEGAGNVVELDPRAKFMTEHIDSCGLTIGEIGGTLKVVGIMQVKSQESSVQIENMIKGGFAMMEMRKADDRRISDLILGHAVNRTSNTVRVEMDLSIEVIIDHLEKQMKKAV